MGGMLNIKSSQGEGTCVVVVSPYENGLH
jgi:hypothetical protein